MVSDSCYASMIHPGGPPWTTARWPLQACGVHTALRCLSTGGKMGCHDLWGSGAATWAWAQRLTTERWPWTTWGNPRLREVYFSSSVLNLRLAHSMSGMCIWYMKICVLLYIYISICFPHVCQDRVTGNISQPGQVSLSSSWVARCRKMSIHRFQPVWQCSTPQMSTTQVPHSVWRKVPLSVAQMWGAWDTLVAVVGQCTVSMICAGIRLYPESFMNVICKRRVCHMCQTFRWWYIMIHQFIIIYPCCIILAEVFIGGSFAGTVVVFGSHLPGRRVCDGLWQCSLALQLPSHRSRGWKHRNGLTMMAKSSSAI